MLNFARVAVFIGLAASTAMAQIALPSLSSWTRIHTSALVNAKTVAALNEAANATLAQNVSIVINGVAVSRDAFLQDFIENLPGRIGSNVSVPAIIEDPFNTTTPEAVRRRF